MKRDIRDTGLYRDAEELFRGLRQPAAGLISDADDVSTNGFHAVFSGTIVEGLQGATGTRICLTELETGDTRVLTFGPNTDRLPKFSPDARLVGFLSDRKRAGDFQLYLLDLASGAAQTTPPVDGWVEYLHWSPDGRRILLGVAAHGADVAGIQGAITSRNAEEELPSWMPAIDSGDGSRRARQLWIYEVATHSVSPLGHAGLNIWEAVWCGDNAVAAVASSGSGESEWYVARLHVIDVLNGVSREIYAPQAQLGWPASSPSGERLAIVEAISSDRWIVAGDVHLIDTTSGCVQTVNTNGVDITYTEWRSDGALLLAGHRGLDSVVGLYDLGENTFKELWCSREITAGPVFMTVAGFNDTGDCVLVGESFLKAPEIGLIRHGSYHAVRSFALGCVDATNIIDAVETVTWCAPDGLEIQGWLLRPKGKPPHPLIMNIHGGPVWHMRSIWLGRRAPHLLMLVQQGYAVFFPNPRGSTGRGQDFSRQVLGDMGGADTYDILSGLDHLVEIGVADPKRLGVTGGSYGGFMTSWLITQDRRFAAAVSVAPITNHVTEQFISNIPHFVSLFVGDEYTDTGGKYFERSPVMHAHKVTTPTLNVCGALDRCTPPEEAMQFHNALLNSGVNSVLVTYPEEGHGVRKCPAAIDYTARVVAWFHEHMPSIPTK